MDTKKQCTYCHEIKPLSEFHKMKTGSLGVRGRCKICTKATTPPRRKRRPQPMFTPIVTLATDRLEAYKFESRHPVRSRKEGK